MDGGGRIVPGATIESNAWIPTWKYDYKDVVGRTTQETKSRLVE
jgi:hypothetical protein